MSLNALEVKKIAHLSRLAIDEQAIPHYAENLSNILALIEQMNAVDTESIEPMAHPLDVAQRLREDVISEPNLRDRFQALAPKTEAGLYLVPKVIE